MKKVKKIIFLILIMIIISGCGKNNVEKAIDNLTKKIEDIQSYHLEGIMDIVNNENTYSYDVDVVYKKDNNFKVSLKNKINNHEQIILRNNDGVYILTPSLNKSFKFQSEWPYNNSQSYLLQNLINDIKNDNEKIQEENENGYIITTKTNYSNNKDLKKQKIYINKDKNIYQVEVLGENDIVKIKMMINNIDYNSNYNDDFFKLENNMQVSKERDEHVSKIEDIIYPMYIPQNTFLSSQDKVTTETGERVIMTFAGDNPFMLIQETINQSENGITSVNGEPYQLHDSIGIIDNTSITWVNQGMEYYLVSNTLNQEQLINVANSLTTTPLEK
jgi:outer membrane lipoprotein-sorting protein